MTVKSESNVLYSASLVALYRLGSTMHFNSKATLTIMILTIASIYYIKVTCLTNHIGSILCHIMPLTINRLVGVHTYVFLY